MHFTILQIDPGVKEFNLYSLVLNDGTSLGMVLVANTSHGDYTAGEEYWSLTQAGLDAIGESSSLTFDGAGYDWSELPETGWPGSAALPMFRMPARVEWDEATAPSNVFATNSTTNNVTLAFGLSYSGGSWSGQLVWHQTATATYVISSGETKLEMTAEPSGSSWTSVTVTPTAV